MARSAGIGRATARHFAANGWRVALFARGHNGLQQAKAEIEAAVSRTGMALAARMA